jgi:cation/acetate symporter
LYTTAPAIGVFAKYNLIQSLNAQPLQEVRQIDWVSKWENTGLLVLEDKNGDGIIEYSGDKAANEVTIDRDIIVLSTPEVADLAPFIIALVAAGGLAAALSTAAGLILAMSSAVSHDLYYRILKTDATERQRLRVARIMIVISVITAVIWGQPAGL